jgi:hypothetical protein
MKAIIIISFVLNVFCSISVAALVFRDYAVQHALNEHDAIVGFLTGAPLDQMRDELHSLWIDAAVEKLQRRP